MWRASLGINTRTTKFSRHLPVLLLPVLLLILFTSLSSCRKETGPDPELEAFRSSIRQGHYFDGLNRYKKNLDLQGDAFNHDTYKEVLLNRIEQELDAYQSGAQSYDLTYLELHGLGQVDLWKKDLGEALAAAKASIYPSGVLESTLNQIQLYIKDKDYDSALILLDRTMEQNPDRSDLKSKRIEIVDSYKKSIVKEVDELLDKPYPRTTLALLDRSIQRIGQDQDLEAMKKKAQDLIQEQETKIQQQVIESEFQALLDAGDLAGSKAYIEKLGGWGYDMKPYQERWTEKRQAMIQYILDNADSIAGQDIGNGNKIREAIKAVEAGLESFPDEPSLKEKKEQLEKSIPDNPRDLIVSMSGPINTNAGGNDANGNSYPYDRMDTPFGMKAGAKLTYGVGESHKTRLVLNPQVDDVAAYKDAIVTVSISGSKVYEDKPFAEDLGSVNLSYDVVEGDEVEISIRFSKETPMIDRFMNRGVVLVQLYLIK